MGNFYFYNNGITITCSQFGHNALQQGNWRVQMSDLQIVNGGQTARTVQRVIAEAGNTMGDAEVLVCIYELQPLQEGCAEHRGLDYNDFVEAITLATNSQNPVDLV